MPTTHDSLKFTIDPAWPWSFSGIGLPSLLIVAGVLIGLTLWTYRGVRKAGTQRVLILIGLRLVALLLACSAVLRPSLAYQDEQQTPSTLIIMVDDSESMTIQDQHGGISRWEYLQRLLRECEPQLQELRDKYNVSAVYLRFSSGVNDYDPKGKADGKRTDFGEMIHTLHERYGSERSLRGIAILSDGADNGNRYQPQTLLRQRMLACPIHTFAFGQTSTTSQQRDIAFTAIAPSPTPVATKGQLKVKGTIDAPGFENANVMVRLFIDGEQVAAEKKNLLLTTGNEVTLTCDAPANPGEIKVTMKIDPLKGETTESNNEISTYVTVTKEGISVLYVEGKYRAWEPKFLRWALGQEPSIRLFESVRLTEDDAAAGDGDLYNFGKQHYDVIILGDITASRLSGRNGAMLDAIYKQVNDKGAGLMMIGGYETFGNSDWANTPIAKLLPVRLDVTGQVEGQVQMVPTRDGLRHYLLRLADNEADNTLLWSKLTKLDGITKLGSEKPGAIVLARASTGEPIMVAEKSHGAGRTLAFAGDTTWRWRRTEDGVRAHTRFWRQVVLWLAKRDEADGNVLVLPDTRRLPAGGKLGFVLRLRGKGGVDIPEKDARFEVSVIGPDKVESKVTTARDHGEERGTFWKTDLPGEYTLVARGSGVDSDGKLLDNLAPARARFVVYQDDAEMARQAADHEFLDKLASAGLGKMHQPEDLKLYLKDLETEPMSQNKPKSKLWPDWRKKPLRDSQGQLSGREQASTLAASGILPCFLLFATVLCLEWFLRRYWGLV